MLTIHVGDCLDKLKGMEPNSVQCCVTSPPYWGLRDYGIPPTNWPACSYIPMSGCPAIEVPAWSGNLGLEPTPEMFIAHLTMVFNEVRRVLRPDGTCWMNLGDSYAANYGSGTVSPGDKQSTNSGSLIDSIRSPKQSGLKQKDMCGIPWRAAFALQASGWYLRSDIIWHKPNPMPESVTDRPTKSHEYIFLLTKSQKYFYDAEAIMEQCSPNTHARVSQDTANQVGSARANGGTKTNGNMKSVVRAGVNPKAAQNEPGNKQNASFAEATCLSVMNRNKRTVWTDEDHQSLALWLSQCAPDLLSEFLAQSQNKPDLWSIATSPYSEAHFATFPPDLIKPCILAGTSPKACEHCGSPFERVVEKSNPPSDGDSNTKYEEGSAANRLALKRDGARTRGEEFVNRSQTTGWIKTCKCNCSGTAKCTVLDIFGGSGTTGQVAIELGRQAILIELNPNYIPLIQQRCATTPGLGI